VHLAQQGSSDIVDQLQMRPVIVGHKKVVAPSRIPKIESVMMWWRGRLLIYCRKDTVGDIDLVQTYQRVS